MEEPVFTRRGKFIADCSYNGDGEEHRDRHLAEVLSYHFHKSYSRSCVFGHIWMVTGLTTSSRVHHRELRASLFASRETQP